MRTISQRRQAILDVFDVYEKMHVLFTCIPGSPALWEEDDDDEIDDLKEQLVEVGLLDFDGGIYTTTPPGREALIAYINGDEQGEE